MFRKSQFFKIQKSSPLCGGLYAISLATDDSLAGDKVTHHLTWPSQSQAHVLSAGLILGRSSRTRKSKKIQADLCDRFRSSLFGVSEITIVTVTCEGFHDKREGVSILMFEVGPKTCNSDIRSLLPRKVTRCLYEYIMCIHSVYCFLRRELEIMSWGIFEIRDSRFKIE